MKRPFPFLRAAPMVWLAIAALCPGFPAGAADAVAPGIAHVEPPPGQLGGLSSITVVFTEPVTGVGFSDLLVNDRPATGVSGSGNTYIFTIDPIGYGPASVRFEAGAGITDLAEPANVFDTAAPGATWNYDVIDLEPPTVVSVNPAPGNTVRALVQVEVRFSEAVEGVDAADLQVNGRPATAVSGAGAGPYVFTLPAVDPGDVRVAWATEHGIRDRAIPPHPFAGGTWSYTFEPATAPAKVRINEILAGTSGNTGLRDEDGDLVDWIELRNFGTREVNLRGWSVSDDPNDPGKWVFPDVKIPAGGYLVVFASAKDRRPTSPGARLHTNFQLAGDGEYLGLFDAESPRGRVSEFAPAFPLQRNDVSYGYDVADRLGYFPVPTPGAANGSSLVSGVLPPVDFNVGRGLFEGPFDLHLSSAVDGAEIRLTTDGSEPTATTGTRYTAPLSIRTTTLVRAAAFKAGNLPSTVVTHTFIFPAQVVHQPALPPGVPAQWIDTQGRTWTADYEMDPEIVDAPAYRDRILPALKSLPVVSIVTRPADMFDNANGIYPKSQARGPAWERPASVEFIDWQAGSAVQANCGVQMQGNSVRDPVKTAKHSFRLVFKGDYGPAKLHFRLFPDSPLEEFDTLNLRADFNNSWMHWNSAQRTRGQRVRDAWMKDSQRALGGLSSHSRFLHLYVNGLYWGLYDATERPDATFAAAYEGGSPEEYDVVNEGQLVEGDMTAYNAMRALGGLETMAGFQKMEQYLDVPAYIDYLLLHFYAGHEDWFTDKNWYASRRRRPGEGFRYLSWDGEMIFLAPTQNIVTRTDQPSGLHAKLVLNAQYRMDFADRVQKHFFADGALTPAAVTARYEKWASLVESAMVAESARWGDYRRDVHPYSSAPYELYTVDGHFTAERQRLLRSYFPSRTATVLAQLKTASLYPANVSAPALNQRGGRVPAGFRVTLSAPLGTLYFTTDGTDPRARYAGTVAPGAQVYVGQPVTIQSTTRIKARARFVEEWSALTDAVFEVDSPDVPLAITEIHYHPAGGDPYEFVELRNIGAVDVDASGFSWSGIDYVFPPGSTIAPGRTLVLASGTSPGSFAARYPGVEVFGWFGGSLADGGERLALRDRVGRTIESVDYDDAGGWPRSADGNGSSLERLDPRGDPDAPAGWRASRVEGGTPGRPTEVGVLSTVRLNEIFPAGGPGTVDWIELRNAGAEAVELAGWSLTDDSEPRKFVFPAGARIPANGLLIVACVGADAAGLGGTGAPFEAPFALDRQGETVSLHDSATNRVDAVTYGLLVPNFSLGRVGDDSGWRLCTPTAGDPNQAQALASPTALAINEWLADAPPGGTDWIELFNPDPALPVALSGCSIVTSNAAARVASLSFVPAGGFVVLAADERPGADHLDLRLPAAGGSLALLDPAGAELDRVNYGRQSAGVSEGRLPDGTGAWTAFPGASSPGASNYIRQYRGAELGEVLAWNTVALPGGAAEVPPGWVELRNSADTPFDLGGMGLVLEPGTSPPWRFPAGFQLPAGGLLLVRCDPAHAAVADPVVGFHLGRALSRTGGGVWLLDPADRVADAVEFGFAVRDRSVGRTPSGWQLLATPTPGAENSGPAALGMADAVRINEWLGSPAVGDDWIELHNRGDLPVALAGLRLTDHPGLSGQGAWAFGPLSFLGPHGFVRLIADENPGAGPDHVDFRLAAAGDALLLLDPAGQAVDVVYYGRQRVGVSLGRLPDGADGPLQEFARPTPGVGNAEVTYRAPVLEAVTWEAGELRLRLVGDAGPEYRLERTRDFVEWRVVSSERPAALPFEWRVPSEAGEMQGFFRVTLWP